MEKIWHGRQGEELRGTARRCIAGKARQVPGERGMARLARLGEAPPDLERSGRAGKPKGTATPPTIHHQSDDHLSVH